MFNQVVSLPDKILMIDKWLNFRSYFLSEIRFRNKAFVTSLDNPESDQNRSEKALKQLFRLKITFLSESSTCYCTVLNECLLLKNYAETKLKLFDSLEAVHNSSKIYICAAFVTSYS